MPDTKTSKLRSWLEKHGCRFRYWFHSLWVFGCLFLVLAYGRLVNTHSFVEGQPSPIDFHAPYEISVVDEVKTALLKDRARASIAPRYIFDAHAVSRGEAKIRDAFYFLHNNAQIYQDRILNDKNLPKEVEPRDVLTKEQWQTLQESLPVKMSEEIVEPFLKVDQEKLVVLETTTLDLYNRVVQKVVTQENIATVKKGLALENKELLEKVGEDYREGLLELVQGTIEPNRIIDLASMDKAKDEAVASVEPVNMQIQKGQTIVRKGDIIGAKELKALNILGYSTGDDHFELFLGYGMFVAALIAMLVGYIKRLFPEYLAKPKRIVTLGISICIAAVLCKIFMVQSPYWTPVVIASLLVTILHSERIGYVVTGVMAVYVGVLTKSFSVAAVSFIVGFVGVLAVPTTLMWSGLFRLAMTVASANLVSAGVFELISPVSTSSEGMVQQILYGGANGLISTIIVWGVLSVMEQAFGVTTRIGLVDLSNPNHSPLLQKLMKTAPGTYQHSAMVANLAEAAAQEIGADGLLCRVGAYYHDIGKMKRPRFFIENQAGGENPHDKLAPNLSVLTIVSHVRDGVEMAQQHNLPDEIIDCIKEHHGTSLVAYFYYQAQKLSETPILEDDFRYPGPNPQSKETGILMICDGVEAACRTLKKHDEETIRGLVDKIVQKHLDDGQFDECGLSLKEIKQIKEVVISSLKTTYHSRIEYPDVAELSPKSGRSGKSS